MANYREEMLGFSDEDKEFFECYMNLPEDTQVLYRLMIMGDPQQQIEAENAIYDLIESRGHDVSEYRANMAKRLEEEAKK